MRRSKESGLLLTEIIHSQSLLLWIVLLAGGCVQDGARISPPGKSYGKIIYDTPIINRDSSDTWATECLSELDRKALVDNILNAVYEGKVTPYDYFSGEKLSVSQIKKLKSSTEFTREDISKIKFEERWIWDDLKAEMHKQVISLTLAYDVYDNSGKTRGQKPLFKIVFSQ